MTDQSMYGSRTTFWRVLPPVPLFGLGTPAVESVEHYVLRLARISGTTPRKIVSLSAPFDEQGARSTASASFFCGPGKIYKRRIENLEALTGVNTIRCGSFYLLDEVLTHKAIGRDSRFRRWCPQCYTEWDESSSWEPLQWLIDLRVTCPIHGCDLEEFCRACGAKQTRYKKHALRRHCSRCKNPLAGSAVTNPRSAYVKWTEQQLDDLVRLCATPGNTPLPGATFDTFSHALKRNVQHIAPKGTATALDEVLQTSWKSQRGETWRRVDIGTLLLSCAFQATPVSQLLLNPVASAGLPLIGPWNDHRPLDLGQVHEHQRAQALEIFLDKVWASPTGGYLPHPRRALLEFNLTSRTMHARLGELYKRCVCRHRNEAGVAERRRKEQLFTGAMERIRAVKPNPFSQLGWISKAFARTTGTTVAEAKCVIAIAVTWQREVELAKACVLGLTPHELRAYKKLGRLMTEGL
jgi:TniQ